MNENRNKIKKGSGKIINKSCIIPISLSNPNHYGKKFELILGWASQNYQEIIINIADSLYRHNYLTEKNNENTAYKIAIKEGEKWITKHDKILQQYNIKEIYRWDKWINDVEFSKNAEIINHEYYHNKSFNEAINKTIKVFSERDIRKNKQNNFSKKQSLKFLLEEAAVYPIIGKQRKIDRVYPAQPQEWLKYLKTNSTGNIQLGMKNFNFIRLYFY